MFSRRELILGGGFASSLRSAAAQRSSNDLDTAALNGIQDAIRQLGRVSLPELTEIRDKQHTHFKINQKLPDFVDVGLRVWEHLYDWHLENHIPLKITRTGDRFEMEVMLTTAVLRSDIADGQIGVPYDR